MICGVTYSRLIHRNKKVILFSIVIIILVVGGYFATQHWNTPDTAAFQDEFTSQFLVKNAETPDGFHLFESGTGKYTMLFPDNYVMSDGSYYKKKGVKSGELNTENVFLRQDGISPKEDDLAKGINLLLKPDGNNVVDIILDRMLEDIHASGETKVETYKDTNIKVYFAVNTDKYKTEDGNINIYFYSYGFILDENSSQAIYFELEQTCFHSNDKKCAIDFDI